MKLFVVLAVFIFALYIVGNEAQTQTTQQCKDQVTAFCTAHKTDYKALLTAANKADKKNKKGSKCVTSFCKNKKIPKKCLKTKMLCTAASVCVAATSPPSSG